MDFRLNDDQAALQASVERYCGDRWPIAGLAERAPGLDRCAWDELSELGVVSLMAAEADGGAGLGAVEAVVVFEQLGRHLVPGPLLWSALAATVLPEVAAAGTVVAGVIGDPARPHFIDHALEPEAVLVLQRTSVAVVDPGELSWEVAPEPLDPLNPVAVVTSLPAGRVVADGDAAVRLRSLGTVLAAALQLGVSQAALEVAVEYALEREQFGVPIGSFQALKHLMADMYVRTGLARSATYAAAAVLDDPTIAPVDRSVSGAKLLAGEAAIDNSKAAVQVLGGMGFTWEMPPNFLLKRAWVLDQQFGTSGGHALALADALADEVGADAARGEAA